MYINKQLLEFMPHTTIRDHWRYFSMFCSEMYEVVHFVWGKKGSFIQKNERVASFHLINNLCTRQFMCLHLRGVSCRALGFNEIERSYAVIQGLGGTE